MIDKFKPFSWTENNHIDRPMRIIELAKDIVSGAQLASELLERSELEESENVAPDGSDEGKGDSYLSEFHRGVLQRYIISSLKLMGSEIDHYIATVQEKEARSE